MRADVIGTETNLAARLNNSAKAAPQAATNVAGGLERLADVPIHFADAVARRSPALLATLDGQAPKAWLSAALSQKLGIVAGDRVSVKQGQGSAVLTADIDKALPENVVRVAAAHASTAALGSMFGAIVVEKA